MPEFELTPWQDLRRFLPPPQPGWQYVPQPLTDRVPPPQPIGPGREDMQAGGYTGGAMEPAPPFDMRTLLPGFDAGRMIGRGIEERSPTDIGIGAAAMFPWGRPAWLQRLMGRGRQPWSPPQVQELPMYGPTGTDALRGEARLLQEALFRHLTRRPERPPPLRPEDVTGNTRLWPIHSYNQRPPPSGPLSPGPPAGLQPWSPPQARDITVGRTRAPAG
jgi:hypothetical protein